MIMAALSPAFVLPADALPNVEQLKSGLSTGYYKGGKGQLRAAKPKASGAAALKRAAKTRNNIRKRVGK
jgi:hypothetical protein